MFKGLFKPLSKRDAKIASVIFGIALIILVIEALKEIFGGATFDEVRNVILLTVFCGIIEFGMITIVTSKDKGEEAAGETKELPGDIPAEGFNEREGSEEFTEGLNEEFGTGAGSEGADFGAESGDAGESGEAGGGGAEG